MSIVKTIFDTRFEKKDETYPIKLRLFHGSISYIAIDINIKKDQWEDEQVVNHPNHKQLNKIIKNRQIQAENILLELAAFGRLKKLSCKEVKLMIEKNSTDVECLSEVKKEPSIADHFQRYIDNTPNNSTKMIYQVTVGKISQFKPKDTLQDIDYSWLMNFDAFLSSSCEINTRAIHMRNIRAVYNDAMKRKLIDRNLYPFWDFKIKKTKTIKKHLTIEQLKSFRDYPVQPHQKKYQDLFMLSFYLLGINMADLLRLKEINNGRIEYIRKKTGRFYSVEVLPEAQAIIDKYTGQDYLIDVMDHYTNYKDFTSRMNSSLKQIGHLEWVNNKSKDPKRVKTSVKKITPIFPDLIVYTARKSLATIASKLGIQKDTIAMALGHGAHTVTDDYIDFDMAKVDQANRDILNALK